MSIINIKITCIHVAGTYIRSYEIFMMLLYKCTGEIHVIAYA